MNKIVKRILCVVSIISLTLCMTINSSYAVSPHVKGVMVNETWINLSEAPVFSFSYYSLYLPLEDIVNVFGFTYSYDKYKDLITIKTNTKELYIYNKSKTVSTSAGNTFDLQHEIIESSNIRAKTHLIYYKDIATLFETTSEWLDATECVYINSPIAYNYYSATEHIGKRYTNMGWLYDSRTEKEWYYTGVYDYGYIEYHVPEINMKSLDAIKLSDRIYSKYYSEINDEIKNVNNGCSPNLLALDYKEEGTDEFLSVVVHRFYDGGCCDIYDTYNISKKTGKIVTNKDLIQRTGLTENQFLDVIRPMMANKFYESNNKPSNDEINFYWRQYNWTVNELCNVEIPMYVGNNNHLWIIPQIGSIAGGDCYQHIIDTGLTIW